MAWREPPGADRGFSVPDAAVPGAPAGPAAVRMSPGRGLTPRPLPYQESKAMRCAAEFRGVIIICPDKCSSRLPRATPWRPGASALAEDPFALAYEVGHIPKVLAQHLEPIASVGPN